MNVVKFNDRIERIFGAYQDKTYLERFGDWRTAPLFDYATTYDHEKQEVAKLLGDSQMKIDGMPWPFDLFRLALVETAVPWADKECGQVIGTGKYVTAFVASKRGSEINIFVDIREMWDHATVKDETELAFLVTDIVREDSESFVFLFSLCVNGIWVAPDENVRRACQPIVGSAITAFVTFLFDAMSPTTHVAVVKPAQENRSVEWLRARTHYTLIAHGHPANTKGIYEGARIAANRAEELQRMAHNRRAHFRTLKAERFRFARGSQVFVRATWVGPKEWRDEGSRQIYRILEPA